MFGARRNILFIIKVKVFEVMKWLFKSSAQLCSLLSVEWLTNCEHIVQSLFSTCILVAILRSTPNHTPLKYRSLIKKSGQVRPLYRLIFITSQYHHHSSEGYQTPRFSLTTNRVVLLTRLFGWDFGGGSWLFCIKYLPRLVILRCMLGGT
jgi:hypothetical protein